MSLPDEAENRVRVRSKIWHALPAGTPRPKLAKFQSPHTIHVITACGAGLTLGSIAPKGTPVNCPLCNPRPA